jgi:hypothetical protein
MANTTQSAPDPNNFEIIGVRIIPNYTKISFVVTGVGIETVEPQLNGNIKRNLKCGPGMTFKHRYIHDIRERLREIQRKLINPIPPTPLMSPTLSINTNISRHTNTVEVLEYRMARMTEMIRLQRENADRLQRMHRLDAHRPGTSAETSIQIDAYDHPEGNDELEEGSNPCSICLTNKPVMTGIKCGHLCLCVGCSKKIYNGPQANCKCPICRTRWHNPIRVYN